MAPEEEQQTVAGAEEENKTDSLETTRSTTTTDKTAAAVSVKRRERERARERERLIRLCVNVSQTGVLPTRIRARGPEYIQFSAREIFYASSKLPNESHMCVFDRKKRERFAHFS